MYKSIAVVVLLLVATALAQYGGSYRFSFSETLVFHPVSKTCDTAFATGYANAYAEYLGIPPADVQSSCSTPNQVDTVITVPESDVSDPGEFEKRIEKAPRDKPGQVYKYLHDQGVRPILPVFDLQEVIVPGAGGHGDPFFDGFDGEHFEVKGTPQKWFNLLTDADTQVNAFFEQQGKTQTFMTQMAVMMGEHAFLITPTAVSYNGTKVPEARLDRFVSQPGVSRAIGDDVVAQRVENSVRLVSSVYAIDISMEKTGDSAHLNIGVELKDAARRPHGIIGQSAHHQHTEAELELEKQDHEGEHELEGTYEDYEVSSAFGTDFRFNLFV